GFLFRRAGRVCAGGFPGLGGPGVPGLCRGAPAATDPRHATRAAAASAQLTLRLGSYEARLSLETRLFRVTAIHAKSFPVGDRPQHVVPSYNLRTLYVTTDVGNSLTAIHPRTARPDNTIPSHPPLSRRWSNDRPGGIRPHRASPTVLLRASPERPVS